jgi:hypothetical protein
VDRRRQIGQEAPRRREGFGFARDLVIDDAVARMDVATASSSRSSVSPIAAATAGPAANSCDSPRTITL